jgi:hypothetical protein
MGNSRKTCIAFCTCARTRARALSHSLSLFLPLCGSLLCLSTVAIAEIGPKRNKVHNCQRTRDVQHAKNPCTQILKSQLFTHRYQKFSNVSDLSDLYISYVYLYTIYIYLLHKITILQLLRSYLPTPRPRARGRCSASETSPPPPSALRQSPAEHILVRKHTQKTKG